MLKRILNRLFSNYTRSYYLEDEVKKTIYFEVFNDLLYLMKDMDLKPKDLDKIFTYFEEKTNV